MWVSDQKMSPCVIVKVQYKQTEHFVANLEELLHISKNAAVMLLVFSSAQAYKPHSVSVRQHSNLLTASDHFFMKC